MLTEAWFPLEYHHLQSKLWRTNAKRVAVAAGRGSGKTELARRRIVRYLPVKKPWSDPLYFYALPTVATAKRIAWVKIKDLIPRDWLKKVNESELKIETVFGSTLFVLGMDKPNRAEGVQYDGGIIDESSDQKPSVFNLNILPALSHRSAWCWRIGVPKRSGVGAKDFKEFCGLKDVEYYNWTSEEILTKLGKQDELEWAKEHLDAKDYNEQYNATWETAGGLVFYAYDDTLNTADWININPNLPLIIGSDFNVDPMAWVVGQVVDRDINGKKQQIVQIYDELFIRNTNTPNTLNELFRRYGHHKAGFQFYGDASSRARKTSASMSDFLLIKQDTRFAGARIFYPQANPRIMDRFAACNGMLCNAKGERRVLIHPRCKHLRDDLQNRAYCEGKNEPDDYNDIGHISDAFGYIIHRLFPIRVYLTENKPQIHTHIPNLQREAQLMGVR